ncbi:MAG TPA: type I pullulanase [Lentisphaeria bacterium]|nr:MAG: type I pullulanase [Lentisphaerae bacterium GWF2_38_69]HBM15942.1 type I pullulanase [Lentisphaeria bacterium]
MPGNFKNNPFKLASVVLVLIVLFLIIFGVYLTKKTDSLSTKLNEKDKLQTAQQAELSSSSEKIEALSAQIDERNKLYNDKLAEFNQVKNEVDALAAQLNEKNEVLNPNWTQFKQIKEEVDALSKQLNEKDKLYSSKLTELDSAKKKITDLTNKLVNTNTSSVKQNNQLADDEIMGAKILNAWLDDYNKITIKLPSEIKFDSKTQNRFEVIDFDKNSYAIASVSPKSGEKTDKSDTAVITLTNKLPDIISRYFVVVDKKDTYLIIARNVLNNQDFQYKGEDLGFIYKPIGTEFRIWAPLALGVSVKIYDYYNSGNDKFSEKQAMFILEKGVWKGFISGDLKGKYYLYEITQRYDGKIRTLLVQDPYSRASAVNSGKSLIFDMEEVNKSVLGWNSDRYVRLNNNVDAVINELHLRDYTISPTSGIDLPLRGKYLGLAQYNSQNNARSSTGLDNLIELGVTHVQILPTFDYGTGDEAEMNNCYTWYNWGYDPVLYNSPEGSYARNPNDIFRLIEYKTLIQTLHSNSIGVIFDGVYNHTFKTGFKSRFSVFDKIVPYYFYRVGDDGKYYNGSSCRNDIATERPMVRKFILDSTKYWVKEFHVDGFRFDLMGLMDKETVVDVHNMIKAMNPNAIIYGEGWNIPTGIDESQRMIQENVQKTGVGAFNDGIRNCLVGNILINKSLGYVQGADTQRVLEKLKKQIQGAITGGNEKKQIPVATPNESINYAGCHDNLCLWDKIKASLPKDPDDKTLKRAMLALGCVITSQGIPLFYEGDEFGRSKQGNDNSFNCNEPFVNPINWDIKTKNMKMFDFVKGLIAIRKAHPAFRMTDTMMIQSSMRFFTMPKSDSIIAYALINNANGDSWKTIIVAFNNTDSEFILNVVGKWFVVVKGHRASNEYFDVVMNSIAIPPLGMTIVYGNDSIANFEF